MKRFVISAALVLHALAAPTAHAQEAPYFHCQAWVGGGRWTTPAVWAHVQAGDFRTAYDDCVEISREIGHDDPSGCVSTLDPTTGLLPEGNCYMPTMLGYSIQQLVSREKAVVEIPACWGTNDADGSLLVITVLGAPVQYAEPWCQGLQWF